jgi:hypothetical protein
MATRNASPDPAAAPTSHPPALQPGTWQGHPLSDGDLAQVRRGGLQTSCVVAHCVSRGWRAGKGGFVQDEQLAHWYAYVAWEASNVQRLDQAALAARVVLAYEQVRAFRMCGVVRLPRHHLAQPGLAAATALVQHV